jgi:hypothetical protein
MPTNKNILQQALNKGKPIDLQKLPDSDRSIAEKYIKLGYTVTQDNSGKLQFAKDGQKFNTGDFEFEGNIKEVSKNDTAQNARKFNTGDFQFEGNVAKVPKSSIAAEPTNFNTGDFQFSSGIKQVPKNAVGQTPTNFNTGDFQFESNIKEVPKGSGGGSIDLSKFSEAERGIAEKYKQLGYDVSLDSSGKLQFAKGGVVANKRSDGGMAGVSAGTSDPNRIPLPDYNNPESRLGYAKAFTEKYGPLMEKRGDTPLRINEKPAWGTDTSINLAKKSASQFQIDPALFYASSMEEGQSGLYEGSVGAGKVRWSGNKEYPVSGLWSFGLDSFEQKYPDLIKKGYLPKDFDKNFIIGTDIGSKDKGNGALFKTTDAGVQASAAMLKTYYDSIDQYAKSKNIPLSTKDRDFFALAAFNAGEGVGKQMLSEYYKNNHMQGGAYLKKRPTSGEGLKESSYEQVYENVIRRIQMADALKKEGYFVDEGRKKQMMDQALQNTTTASAPSPVKK